MTTLYEKYGGFSTVSRIVLSFYDKVLDSDQIGDFFEDVDMKRLIDHQTKFIASLMGGPASFSNEMLTRVHAGMNIGREDFDEVVYLLRETLIEFKVDDKDVETILMEIDSKRSVIISS